MYIICVPGAVCVWEGGDGGMGSRVGGGAVGKGEMSHRASGLDSLL